MSGIDDLRAELTELDYVILETLRYAAGSGDGKPFAQAFIRMLFSEEYIEYRGGIPNTLWKFAKLIAALEGSLRYFDEYMLSEIERRPISQKEKEELLQWWNRCLTEARMLTDGEKQKTQ